MWIMWSGDLVTKPWLTHASMDTAVKCMEVQFVDTVFQVNVLPQFRSFLLASKRVGRDSEFLGFSFVVCFASFCMCRYTIF